MNHTEYLDFAIELAREAGVNIRAAMVRPKNIEYKGLIDMVTNTDKEVEGRIISKIKEKYPSHKILAEESYTPQTAETNTTGSQYIFDDQPTWVVDPIDGTTNFVHGYIFVCISIALCINKKPIIGVVYNPILDELYTATKGGGAFLNGQSINVSKTTSVTHSVVSTNYGYDRTSEGADFMLGNVKSLLMNNVQSIRSEGSAAVALCLVAAGRTEAFYEFGIHPWDIAAGVLMIEEAGGVMLDPLDGSELHLESKRVLGATPGVADELMRLLKKTPVPNKYAVIFRRDDGSLDNHLWDDLWRIVRNGDIIEATVGPLLSEFDKQRGYKAWQGYHINVIEHYDATKDPFPAHVSMGATVVSTDSISNKEGERQPCRYMINLGQCHRGDECPFLHPKEEELKEIKRRWAEERTKTRKDRVEKGVDKHSHSGGSEASERALIFVRWLVDTFGVEKLSGGSGVLDIAAGKGQIAQFLAEAYGVNSTTVEPKIRHRSKTYARKLREKVKKERESREISRPPTTIHSMFDGHFMTNHGDLLKRSSVMIGMHSDEVTEPIVDAAIAAGVAFAVVPCCVFSSQNRHRRTRNGEEVTNTTTFIEYLSEKTEGVQTASLDFSGKNTVVFCKGKGE
ncbi:inositol-phosphate phosphatase [Planoprotostelium fungivorum]|uniref:inositol-phosphate phosphatase n=1 Tax=Planoprotostelium fungivorum TaxID=1890364 RepID=A0A2P6NID7_9EUKA|nr:inositol-phosphate phosphatase [Planoprotostelium fungivorum]